MRDQEIIRGRFGVGERLYGGPGLVAFSESWLTMAGFPGNAVVFLQVDACWQRRESLPQQAQSFGLRLMLMPPVLASHGLSGREPMGHTKRIDWVCA